MPEDSRFDVFISYGNADRPWAAMLDTALEQKGIEPFFDQSRMEPGAKWENTLLSSIHASRHMVVLWSNISDQSGWVRREFSHFDAIINDPALAGKNINRRLIFLCLEGEPLGYNSFQMINDIRHGGAYTGGADMVDPNLWQRVVDKIYQSIISDDVAIPVPVVILTTTRDRLVELNSAFRPPVGDSMDALLERIGIGTKADLLPYYDKERTAWRPFRSNYDVWSILDKLKDEVNKILKGISIRWEPVSEDFWSGDIDKITYEAKKLTSGLSVVILDPLALYDNEVLFRFERLTNIIMNNEDALIMTLSPLAMPAPNSELRKLIQQQANTVYTHLYNPISHLEPAQANCDVNINDEMDIKRALLGTVCRHFRTKPIPEWLQNRASK